MLDDAILKAHPHLLGKKFEENLEWALKNDVTVGKSLLKYEIPIVFPTPGIPGLYQDFDISITVKLIKHFVGQKDWTNATNGLPDVDNLNISYLKTAPCFAMVQLLKDYRNWVFHHSGVPQLIENDYILHWDNLMFILQQLRYNVGLLSIYKFDDLDCRSKPFIETVKELLKESMCRIQDKCLAKEEFAQFALDLHARLTCIEGIISILPAEQKVIADLIVKWKELEERSDVHGDEFAEFRDRFQKVLELMHERLAAVEGNAFLHSHSICI